MRAVERAAEVLHLLNAYTWAGRRGACAVTHPTLLCTPDVTLVTCPECLTTLSPAPDQDDEGAA